VTPTTPTVSKCRPAADAWETNRNRGAFTGGAADRDGSAVFFDDFFDAGETQPNA
jgi:hypothetical protein